jgi:two-component system cell cycle response regulator CtrA
MPICIGRLTINLNFRVVTVDDQPVHLTPEEYGILELLSLRKGEIVSKEVLLDHLGVDKPDRKIIDVIVFNLRKKISRATRGHHYIGTVWGEGRAEGWVLREPSHNVDCAGRPLTAI